MANHARGGRDVADKRSALIGAQRNAYVHSDQVGGDRRREADGRWVDRSEAERQQRQERQRVREKANEPLTMGQFVRRNAVYILSVVAVVAIVVMLVFGVRMFANLTAPLADEGEYVSPYDWSNLDRTGGRYAYVVDGQVRSRLGIDVSDHEGEIDWHAVAGDGVDFAIIRLGYRGATEGDLYLDDYYEYNIDQAKAAGLDSGVYFFSQATTEDEARQEADFVLEHLGGRTLEYGVAFDFEDVAGIDQARTDALTNEQLTRIADAFCDRVEQAGYKALVYGNGHDLRSYDVDATTGRPIWWAEYGVERPSHFLNIALWQYASDGRVEGIDASVDMNIDLTGAL